MDHEKEPIRENQNLPDDQSDIEVSVILPVYQEADTIEDLLATLVATLRGMELAAEVVVVDDGSGPDTGRALRRAKDRFGSNLTVVKHLANRGNGAALRSGISTARGRIVVTMDADGQHDPADIERLLAHIPPYDLVIGARTLGYKGDWYRGLANGFYNRFASWLARRKIDDLTSGFRAMRREIVLHFLPLFPEGFSAPTTTTMSFLKAGYNVKFVPVPVGQRRAGESKIRLWRDGARFIALILRMVMLYDPMRIFFPTGLILTILGILAWAAGLINAQRLVFPNSAIFLFSSALISWLLGLVSSQIVDSQVHYFGDETLVLMDERSSDENAGK
jgi:glycosyltransferase involved in cell wall biosynthesis